MEHEFWLRRWREGRTGFHQDCTSPLLEANWHSIGLAPGSRVFVPLAGKSLDMLWLAACGHRVLGIELSSLAVEQFFSENGLIPTVQESPYGTRFSAGAIELIRGDVFDLDPSVLADCPGVYDRAALIALPPELRARYVEDLYSRLPVGCRGLLITLEYPQHEKVGPPFSVAEAEVRARYSPCWSIERLERREILSRQPKFRAEGVTALSTAAYRLQRL